MVKPETFKVTPENGPRPAGSPDHCFYCEVPVGGYHDSECVLRIRTVVVRMTVEYEIEVPESFDKDLIEFGRNEGTWCASNAMKELDKLIEDDGCLCNFARFEYVREA